LAINNGEADVVARFTGVGREAAPEPEPEAPQASEALTADEVSVLREGLQEAREAREQQVADEFFTTPDESGFTPEEQDAAWMDYTEQKVNETMDPFERQQALHAQYEQERIAELDAQAEAEADAVFSELESEENDLISAAMHRHGLDSADAFAGIQAFANASLEAGQYGEPSPEAAQQAIEDGAAKAAAMLEAHKANGGLMSDTTRSIMGRMGKTPDTFGISGSNWRIRS
jgi:hypothetical protein